MPTAGRSNRISSQDITLIFVEVFCSMFLPRFYGLFFRITLGIPNFMLSFFAFCPYFPGHMSSFKMLCGGSTRDGNDWTFNCFRREELLKPANLSTLAIDRVVKTIRSYLVNLNCVVCKYLVCVWNVSPDMCTCDKT